MTSAIPAQRSTNWANTPTESWPLCWFQMNPWSDERTAKNIWEQEIAGKCWKKRSTLHQWKYLNTQQGEHQTGFKTTLRKSITCWKRSKELSATTWKRTLTTPANLRRDICDISTTFVNNAYFHFANYRFLFCKSLAHFHFAHYWFSFRFVSQNTVSLTKRLTSTVFILWASTRDSNDKNLRTDLELLKPPDKSFASKVINLVL